MKEQDYINVRDLSNVMHAYSMLTDITIDNQPNIPKKEYLLVIRAVSKWRDRMFATIQTKG